MSKTNVGKFLLKSFNKVSSKRARNHWARMISKDISKKACIYKGAKITGNGDGLVIGDYSSIGINCEVGSNLKMGTHIMMGPNCVILTRNHKYNPETKVFEGYEIKEVSIGDGTWIGRNVLIMPGAKIGAHCIIAAGAVVPGKEYPDECLIAGNPAVVKKHL